MEIIQRFIPASQTSTRPGIKMNPKYITIHETDNENRGADAEAHARLQLRGNPREASWHLQVDDDSCIQSIPFNEVAWAAGDGRGPGNMSSIHLEICVNSDGNYQQAVQNAAEVTRQVMKQLNIPLANVVQHNHWTGKNCPRHLRAGDRGITWNDFLKLVKNQGVQAPSDGVLWNGGVLKKGQIGRLKILRSISLWKRVDGKLVKVDGLKPGEVYRVYSYDDKFGGQYGVGAGLYVTNMEGYVTYESAPDDLVEKVNAIQWDGMALKEGQIGRITILKPISVWKRVRDGDGDQLKLTKVDGLEPGGVYRVYGYDEKFGGQYSVGSGRYVTNMAGYVKYEDVPKDLLEKVKRQDAVLWDDMILKKGQIGRLSILEPTTLWKRVGDELQKVRELNPGEVYRVYRYDELHGGQFGVGAGLYVTNEEGVVKYEEVPKVLVDKLNGRPKVVNWGGVEFKYYEGQMGRVTVLKPTNLWKLTNGSLVKVRELQPGEVYRVFSYDELHGGQYEVGAGLYVTSAEEFVKFEKPPQALLDVIKKMLS